MSVFSELFGSELEKKQDQVFVNQVIQKVAQLLARKDVMEENIVKAVNNVLCKWAKDKQNLRFVNDTFDKLILTYPSLHEKYHFQKP